MAKKCLAPLSQVVGNVSSDSVSRISTSAFSFPTETSPCIESWESTAISDVKALEFACPHPNLSSAIVGYYSFSMPSYLKGRPFTSMCNGTLFLHIFGDDTHLSISHGTVVTQGTVNAVIGGQFIKPCTTISTDQINTITIEIYPAAFPAIFGFPALLFTWNNAHSSDSRSVCLLETNI